jgi:site-specific recombinase XerD
MLDLLPAPPPSVALAPEVLLDEYTRYLASAGYVDRKVRLWGARTFLRRYPNPEDWRSAPLDEQRALPRAARYFANFLFLRHYLRPTIAYLLTARPQLALAGRRALYSELFRRFHDLGRSLGYAEGVLLPTIHFLFSVMAYAGKSAMALTAADLLGFEQAMRSCRLPPGQAVARRTASNHIFRVKQLLFHAGVLPSAAVRYQPAPARTREVLWTGIPEAISEVVWRYLDQISTVRALDTVTNQEGYLRRFFAWLARSHPEVQELASLKRPHVEAFKGWLHNTPCASGKPYQRPTIAGTLGTLRSFLLIIQEWEWPEAPPRPVVFASDRPVLDRPLPRFLDDAEAAALMQAARTCGDLFTRVCVETLLRTGLRKGEFVRLQLDSVVQVGGSYWLHVPLGKLHTDRYIPLHPEVKRLFDEFLDRRGMDVRGNDLFVIHGRRATGSRVDAAVKRAARAAGLDEHVTPHRLRHTLATQAINRGMSLEAIAALLGHRSLTMTLVYARIANTTVRDQYTAVSSDLDTLYAEAALSAKVRAPGRLRPRPEGKRPASADSDAPSSPGEDVAGEEDCYLEKKRPRHTSTKSATGSRHAPQGQESCRQPA